VKNHAMTLSLAALTLATLGGCASLGSAPEAKGTASRPQLNTEQATQATIATHFARAGQVEALANDPWDPVANGIGNIAKVKPTYTVAADGSGSHLSVQAAVDSAITSGGTARVYILVKPGTYREQLCTKGAPPITLYGLDSDASKVLIVNNKANGTPKDPKVVLNACEGQAGKTAYGTSGSSTVLAYSDGFQAKNLTFSNDFDESTAKNGLQAVAISTTGDKIIFENVRFLGNQDTLQVKSPNVGQLARVYVKNAYIEGDVDYVFGRAVAVFDHSEFKSLTRSGSEGGFVFAPSHAQIFPVGFLVINSKFTSDGKSPAGSLSLGRAWDDSSGTYVAKNGTKYLPNGQLIIRDSVIGDHINAAAPWNKAASTNRPFSSAKPVSVKFGKPAVETEFPVNRLFEYHNSGPGAAK
jgi:pectinesterase